MYFLQLYVLWVWYVKLYCAWSSFLELGLKFIIIIIIITTTTIIITIIITIRVAGSSPDRTERLKDFPLQGQLSVPNFGFNFSQRT